MESRSWWSCSSDLSSSKMFQNFKSIAVVFTLLFLVGCVRCATIESKLNTESLENSGSKENSTFSRRQGFFGLPAHSDLLYFNTPPALYQTALGTEPIVPLKSGTTPTYTSSVEEDEPKRETKRNQKLAKKTKRKTNRKKVKEDEVEIESKTIPDSPGDQGTKRGCPACVSGTCNADLDPATNISGIPVIQIIIAIAVGAFWAGIFIFFLFNFIENDKGGEGYGYSPAPQYGAPVSSYGAPDPYSNHRISSHHYGKTKRSTSGFTFNEMSSWVWDAIDKFTSLYDNGGTN